LLCAFTATAAAACDRDANNNTDPDARTAHASACDSISRVDSLPTSLREASGLTASRHYEGVLWSHNDSDNPLVITAIDTLARVLSTVRIDVDLERSDWEDIAIASCANPQHDCLYLADIGDNYADRPAVRILRFQEPAPISPTAPPDSVASPQVFPFRYPDSPHDAEAIFILPGEQLYVITKGRNAPVALYHYPGTLRPDTVTLERVRNLTTGIVQFPDMVTGASVSADGRTLAVRTYSYMRLYTIAGADSLLRRPDRTIPLDAAHEFQGEGVAMASRNRIFLVGEKGFDTIPPSLIRLSCH
jgi:hypothetical protein